MRFMVEVLREHGTTATKEEEEGSEGWGLRLETKMNGSSARKEIEDTASLCGR